MISFIDFFSDLTNPVLSFLPKALLVSVLSAIVCGVVGTHVVLRGMAFIGDAVAHAVFPGIAIAFALQGSMLLGGAVAGIAIACLVAVFSQNRRIREDTIIGIFFAGAFALGMIIISRVDGYSASLTSFLFGSITGVPDSDIILVAVVGFIVVTTLLVLNKEIVTVSLDRETARAQNLPVFWLDLVLYFTVTAAVVISVRTIGNILVLALLVTPAAAARLLTDNLKLMMLYSAIIGALCSFLGLYLSWSLNLPTGATIVLCVTVVFLLAWVFSPKQGLIAQLRTSSATTPIARFSRIRKA
ncbi:anchored repeat-type ABC transporter permease subunit [Trueperella sp. LYQ143]|uniref:anchored repeat-type ABC transporter permease subunit n=1 Tax=unclassified Trueperella TaxID=2630174 RepID=UPI003982E692